MKTSDAIDHFGGRGHDGGIRRLADAIAISVQGVYQWSYWVPEVSARRLEKLTAGRLKVHPEAPYAQSFDQ